MKCTFLVCVLGVPFHLDFSFTYPYSQFGALVNLLFMFSLISTCGNIKLWMYMYYWRSVILGNTTFILFLWLHLKFQWCISYLLKHWERWVHSFLEVKKCDHSVPSEHSSSSINKIWCHSALNVLCWKSKSKVLLLIVEYEYQVLVLKHVIDVLNFHNVC